MSTWHSLPKTGPEAPLSVVDVGGPAQPLLTIRGLVKHFPLKGGLLGRRRGEVRAVDGVNFEVLKGETLGAVVDLPQPDSPTSASVSPG